MNRRDFLKTTTAAAGVALAGNVAAAQQTPFEPLPLAIQLNMLPRDLPFEEKMAMAARAGFDGIEAYPMDDHALAAQQGAIARQAGVPIHSITYGGWDFLLSDPDPDVRAEGVKRIGNALHTAKAMGADTVLLVPARVNAEVRYAEAYERSQRHIREVLPLAEELEVIVAVENVWNDFLLSPLEFARYVDEFDNPWLKAYFDVGNVVAFGYPQDWIRTLAHRIVRIHLKDFERRNREWKQIRDGDVDWPEVRKALHEVGYGNFATAEVSGGDEAYLRDLRERMYLSMTGQ